MSVGNLRPQFRVSQILCTDNRDRLSISNMKYHSFSIPDRYSAIVSIRQQFNFSSDLISVSLVICGRSSFVSIALQRSFKGAES